MPLQKDNGVFFAFGMMPSLLKKETKSENLSPIQGNYFLGCVGENHSPGLVPQIYDSDRNVNRKASGPTNTILSYLAMSEQTIYTCEHHVEVRLHRIPRVHSPNYIRGWVSLEV